MTERLALARAYVNAIFDRIENADEKRAAYIHSYGVSHCCALLAAKRGHNVELASVAGLLHDVYSYKTGVTTLHAQNGAEMLRVAFKYDLKNLFSDDEQALLKTAIYHHASKDQTHGGFDELLKDADVLQRFSLDSTFGWFQGQRLLRMMEEFSLPVASITVLPQEQKNVPVFNPQRAADIAGALAAKKIVGEKSNAEYMDIIRYFPEDTAFDELKNAWCAAFVYHCCFQAGLLLPIRFPQTTTKNLRFACVSAWHDWGMENGFCHVDKNGFVPERGDIVVYQNIIPKEDKPENSTWCDHIGIVVSCDEKYLMVAEGNVGNKNVSGIVRRARGENIGCYIRIPARVPNDE